jgi:hypothetical protein
MYIRRDSQRTHSAPVESMSDKIFVFVWVWGHPFINVLDFCTIARITLLCTAVIYMNVSAHRRAKKIAHHRCSLVIGGELATSQLETCPVGPVNRPASLCHRSMASLMFLLGVTLDIDRQASACVVRCEAVPYREARYKNSYSSRSCII